MLSKLSLEKSVVKSRFLVFLLLIISLFLLLSAVSAEELTGVDANMGSDFLSDDQPVDNSNGGDDNSEGDNVADGGCCCLGKCEGQGCGVHYPAADALCEL